MDSINKQERGEISTLRAHPPTAVHSEVLPPSPTSAIGNVALPQVTRHPPPLRSIVEFPRTLAQPSRRTTDPSTPSNAPTAEVHPIYHYGLERGHNPTQWALDDDCDISAISIPGHAAYYESQTFRDMKARGETQTSGQEPGIIDYDVPPNEGERETRADKIEVDQSLVLIFGETHVRRANGVRKVDARKQNRNQRAKMRRIRRGEQPKFEWD